MQKKRSIRFSDVLVTLICLSGAALNTNFFIKNLNRALVNANAQPVAIITFKYKTAQRRLVDRMIWDRLKQESPVYNGDTIRTAPLSEATIYFSDGNVMDLYENTLVQVNVSEGITNVNFSEGGIDIATVSSGSKMQLNSGATAVTVESGSQLNASAAANAQGEQSNNALRIQVVQGSASVAGEDGNSQVINEGEVISGLNLANMPTLSVISPLPNTKSLNHSGTEKEINFSWVGYNLPENNSVVIETSSDHSFAQIANRSEFAGINNATLKVNNGNTYWRAFVVTDSGEKLEDTVSSGKIQILDAPTPHEISPVQNYEYQYRTQKPSIRFIWTGNEYATSYLFEVSDNEEMRNPVIQQRTAMPSSIVSTLGHGRWYWRITPFYTLNNIGYEDPSAIAEFEITQSGSLSQPKAYLPLDGNYENISDAKGIPFSWKSENEAQSYVLTLSKNEDMSNPVVKKEVSTNVHRENLASLGSGRYYWTVSQKDSEGNISVPSDVRSFTAMEGKIEHKAVFPPDGYTIGQNLIADTRFTWKSNVPYPTRFQVASDPDFNNLVINENAVSTSFSGRSLSAGTWYWRIAADSSTQERQELSMLTSARSFTVAPPLDKPQTITPANVQTVIIYENNPVTFSWLPVKDAEYYKFTLFLENGTENNIVYENQYITDTKLTLDLYAYQNSPYRWTVEAASDESAYSTRRTGLQEVRYFTLRKIVLVSLDTPTNGTVFDGVQAIKNPSSVKWSTVEKVQNSVFLLSKDVKSLTENNKNTIKIRNPGRTIKLPPLREGNWYWTVKATNNDGFDISAKVPKMFEITPIPKLPSPDIISPEENALIDAKIIRKSKTIDFKWQPVQGADSYRINFYKTDSDKKRNKPIQTIDIPDGKTEYSIPVNALKKGTNYWAPEALSHIESGVLLQEGETDIHTLTVSLPALNKPVLVNPGELYAK